VRTNAEQIERGVPRETVNGAVQTCGHSQWGGGKERGFKTPCPEKKKKEEPGPTRQVRKPTYQPGGSGLGKKKY